MLEILRYSVVSTFENVTKHWKSFFLISLVFLLIALIVSALALFLYVLFEIIITGYPAGDAFMNALYYGDGESIMMSMFIPLIGIYSWYYLFFIKKGQGSPTVKSFFRNTPSQGWGASFVIAVILVVSVTFLGLLIPDPNDGLSGLLNLFGGYSTESRLYYYLRSVLNLMFELLPYFGVVIVFSKTEYGKFKGVQFKMWLKSGLAIFILAICFQGIQTGVMHALNQYVFSLFKMLDPLLGIGQILTSLVSLIVLAASFIYIVALIAHCIEYPFKNQEGGNMNKLDFISYSKSTDVIDEVLESD